MRFLTTPLSSRQRFAWLTGIALAVILGLAAQLRFRLPLVPGADPDTWGYLHPAIGKLSGLGFAHTAGRNFIYPGLVYCLLALTGSFRAIVIAQHLLGMASGLLLWGCWRQWRAWFARPRLPAPVDALLGLGLVGFFEWSASVVEYEHTIRPEGIFPFFALLELSLQMAFLRAWFVDRRPARAAALAGGALFVAVLLDELKPSFGFALGAAIAPVLAAAWLPWGQGRRSRWRLTGAVGAAVVAAGVLFWWPEHRLSRADPMSTLFLPETLLTVHADIIADQMAADARDDAPTPYAARWLADAHAVLTPGLRHAAEPGCNPYPTLGFNPDILMFPRGSFCEWLDAQLDPAQLRSFGFYYYRRAWERQPARMLAKVGRQLGVFYSFHCPAFFPAEAFEVPNFYSDSLAALRHPNYLPDLARWPPLRGYLDATRQLVDSRTYFPQPALMIDANLAAAVAALPLLGLLLAGLAWAGFVKSPALTGLLAPGALLLLFYAFVFGNCLTIAFVHSMDVPRYSRNLLVFCAPAMVGTVAWLAEFLLACLVPPNAKRV